METTLFLFLSRFNYKNEFKLFNNEYFFDKFWQKAEFILKIIKKKFKYFSNGQKMGFIYTVLILVLIEPNQNQMKSAKSYL